MFEGSDSQSQRIVFLGKQLELIAELSVIVDEFLVSTLLFSQLSAELIGLLFELSIALTQTEDSLFEHLLFFQELISLGSFG